MPCSRRGTDGSVHPFAAEGSAFAPGKESSRDSLTELLHLLATRRQAKGGDEAPLPGKVYLVGTGPGSPELLTLQALRLMQTADVVLYDRLVSPEILGAPGPAAPRLPARHTVKRHRAAWPCLLGGHTRCAASQLVLTLSRLACWLRRFPTQSWSTPARAWCTSAKLQASTRGRRRRFTRCCRRVGGLSALRHCPLLIPTTFPCVPSLQEFAAVGATVVRLKGGDPLVFGRGGEECDFLRALGVPVSVAPGITAASGIAAELGVPLTHRGVATSVRFITGHSREGGEDMGSGSGGDDHVFTASDCATTLVVYMGLATLPSLAASLLQAGLSPHTPSLAVERGTTAVQRRVFGRLGGIAAASVAAQLRSPTLIFIGKCVALSPLWPWQASPEGEVDPAAYQLQTGTPALAQGSHEDRLTHTVVLPDGTELRLPRAQRDLAPDHRT